MEKCVINNCMRERATHIGDRAQPGTYRGMCLICYGKAKAMVARGETTWEELETLGLALPTGGDPFTRALDAARKGKPPE